MRPRVVDFRCRILDNGLFILNLSGSCGSVMTHLSPTGEWFTHSSLLSHSNSLRETWEGAKYISLILVATMFIYFYIYIYCLINSCIIFDLTEWLTAVYWTVFIGGLYVESLLTLALCILETYIGNIVVWKHHLHLETKNVYWKHALDIGNKNWILET